MKLRWGRKVVLMYKLFCIGEDQKGMRRSEEELRVEKGYAVEGNWIVEASKGS